LVPTEIRCTSQIKPNMPVNRTNLLSVSTNKQLACTVYLFQEAVEIHLQEPANLAAGHPWKYGSNGTR
jgi:hypothetical protein